jgi:3D (Asp-Asp-Asp) domain-containing protein
MIDTILKAARIALVFAVGILVGYLHHHYYALTGERDALRSQVQALEGEVLNLRGSLQTSSRVKVMLTAYSNDPISINVPRWRDGRTATNKMARRGLVAADWSIFPPGTLLYIPEYGIARVEDQGSAVRGYHLDLFMDTRNEALAWGVKESEVVVLEMGKPLLLADLGDGSGEADGESAESIDKEKEHIAVE